jgi:hypothetical protein
LGQRQEKLFVVAEESFANLALLLRHLSSVITKDLFGLLIEELGGTHESRAPLAASFAALTVFNTIDSRGSEAG